MNFSINSSDFSSIAGIVAFTIGLVQYLKPRMATVPSLNRVPTLVYLIVAAFAATLFAKYAIHTLSGTTSDLLWQTALGVLTSSGLYETVRSANKPVAEYSGAYGTTPPAAGGTGTAAVLLVAMLFTVGGCSTSKPFQAGAAKLGARLVSRADAYAAGNTMTAEQRHDLATKAEALRFATTDQSSITFEDVSATFKAFKPAYSAFIAADPVLATKPNTLKVRQLTLTVLQTLIDAEWARRAIFGIGGDAEVAKAAAAADSPPTP